MAQHRRPLPNESIDWVKQYLSKRGIDESLYPDKLSTTQWANLKAAFRQIKHVTGLKDKSVNNVLIESNKSLLEENNLLRKQALAGATRDWIKNNFPNINDNNTCSEMALIAKRSLGLADTDYSHNYEVNTWLAEKGTDELSDIIKEAKKAISNKRKVKYRARVKN